MQHLPAVFYNTFEHGLSNQIKEPELSLLEQYTGL